MFFFFFFLFSMMGIFAQTLPTSFDAALRPLLTITEILDSNRFLYLCICFSVTFN